MANRPRYETYPEVQRLVGGKLSHPRYGLLDAPQEDIPTGEFGWRFRDGNGKVTDVGGEGFTRREDARRAIRESISNVVDLFLTEIVDADAAPTTGDVEATINAIMDHHVIDLDHLGNVAKTES